MTAHPEARTSALHDEATGIQLALPFFEGPLDLLLHLIEREELDITNIALVAVADQYMEILHQSEHINLDALADFISIGARLLLLKSRALLPRPAVEGTDDEDEEDLAGELTRQLLEYKLFKEAAGRLRAIETAGLHSYPRIAPPPELPPPTGLDGVTVDLLRQMVEIALTREIEHHEPVHVIRPYKITVQEKVELLRARLETEGTVSFRSVIEACRTRMEIIVSFMAVLELIKARELDAVQDGTFTDILLAPSGEEALEVGDTSEFDQQA
ncbi:MAG: ScpA family protein [Dehalococcoidia bacterium]